MYVRNISKHRKTGRRKKPCNNSCDLWAAVINATKPLPAAKQANFPDSRFEAVVSLPTRKTLVGIAVCPRFWKLGRPAARSPLLGQTPTEQPRAAPPPPETTTKPRAHPLENMGQLSLSAQRHKRGSLPARQVSFMAKSWLLGAYLRSLTLGFKIRVSAEAP